MVSQTWNGTDNQGLEGEVCMVGFSGGSAAEKCVALDRAAVDTEFAKAIANWYPDFKANFIEARFMNWPSEKWTGAGYAFPAPGEVTTVGPLLQQAHAGASTSRASTAATHSSDTWKGR